MAILGLRVSSYRSYLPFRTPLFRCVRKVQPSSIPVGEAIDGTYTMLNHKVHDDDSKLPKWNRFCSENLGITTSMIPKPARKVLNALKKRGYEVYLVGGCVRDLILNRTPKDFDIITSAELKEAAYFIHHGFRGRDKRSNMLLSLFSSLDKLLAPDRPCHCCLWVMVLAFHAALTDRPRNPSVVAAFSLTVHNGGNMMEAISISRSINRTHNVNFYELLDPENLEVQALIDEVMDLAISVKAALNKMTDEHFVSQALEMYPQAPLSDLVFIPLTVYLKVCKIFECIIEGTEKGFVPKQGGKIDFESLALGSLQELRHVFARIVFDTVYPLNLNHTRA